MAGILSASVTGYVAKDPEIRQTKDGKAVANFSIPVSRSKDAPTTWVRVSCFGKSAEFVANYVKKGSVVTATGTLEERSYEGKNGTQKSIEINASNVVSFRTESSGGGTSPAGPVDDDLAF